MKFFKNFSDSYNTSFLQLLSWKSTISIVFIGELRRYIMNFTFTKYKTLSKLKNSNSGVAVICALGPSIYENKSAMRRLLNKASKNKSLFVVNHYLLTEYSDIKPTYQLLSDDNFFYDVISYQYVSLVEKFPEITVLTRMANNYKFKNNKVIYFSGLNYPMCTKKINPKHIVGFSDATILHAIAVAIFMGFSKIVLCGFDNNRFMQIYSVAPKEIFFKGMHSYASEVVEKWGTRDSMIKILSSHLLILKSLHLFKDRNIVITGEGSLVDIFPKIDITTATKFFNT
jgi:hypothetical protein